MRAYDSNAPPTATNYRDVFYPQAPGAQNPGDNRYDLPRGQTGSGAASPGTDDEQIREMENLLAEIGQDVSELKVRFELERLLFCCF